MYSIEINHVAGQTVELKIGIAGTPFLLATISVDCTQGECVVYGKLTRDPLKDQKVIEVDALHPKLLEGLRQLNHHDIRTAFDLTDGKNPLMIVAHTIGMIEERYNKFWNHLNVNLMKEVVYSVTCYQPYTQLHFILSVDTGFNEQFNESFDYFANLFSVTDRLECGSLVRVEIVQVTNAGQDSDYTAEREQAIKSTIRSTLDHLFTE